MLPTEVSSMSGRSRPDTGVLTRSRRPIAPRCSTSRNTSTTTSGSAPFVVGGTYPPRTASINPPTFSPGHHSRGRRHLACAAAAASSDAGGSAGGAGGAAGGAGAGAAAAAATGAVPAPPRVEEPSTAVLLAWFGCGNRSLFAAQCLVEVLVELYREGRTFGELQLSLKMAATQGMRSRRPSAKRGDGETGEWREAEEEMVPPLLQGQEEDVLVSWMALVFLTLEDLGVPRDREPLEQQQQRRQQEAQEAQRELQLQQQLLQQRGAESLGPGPGLGAGLGIGSSMAAGNPYLRGMLGYVRQTLGMYDEGQTLARVAGLQGLVQQSSGAASSPFLVLMQQYTRLVLLTVEVVAAAGLPTSRPLRAPETVLQPSGYSQAFTGSCNAVLEDDDAGSAAAAAAAAAAQQCPPRGLAVRLLMAFMGAVLGSRWSLGKFVDAVRVAYDQGLAADELFSQLDEQEFVQSGGLLPTAGTPSAAPSPPLPPPPAPRAAEASADAPPGASKWPATLAAIPPPTQPPSTPQPAPQHQITKVLLSTWISLSYMALAQLGVPYPAAGQRLGWAWAGFGDPVEALGMNDFVGNVLRQMAGADPRVVPQPDPQTQAQAQAQADTAAEQDTSLDPSTAGGVVRRTGSRRRDGAPMVRVEDESLSATSTAFQVLTQQVELVQAVCTQVMNEGED